MDDLHSLLLRQLRRHFPDMEDVPEDWVTFLEAISDAYRASDDDRIMLERSLELSSNEMLQANADLRALFQAFPDVFYRLNEDGIILDCKAGDPSDLFAAPADAIGRRVQDLAEGMAGARLTAAIRDVGTAKESVSIEYSEKRNGHAKFYEARLLPLLDNEIMMIVRNITNRKHAEMELERSVSMHRATLESTAEGIMVVDNSGRITSFNQRFVDMWRIPEDVIQMRDDDKAIACVLDQLEDPEPFLDKIKELYERPDDESYDMLAFKDGRVFERLISQRIAGESIGRVWSFRDVTEQKLAAEALLNSEEQLRQAQKMEAVGRLAGGIAHDFNNLLTSIMGFTRLSINELNSVEGMDYVKTDLEEVIRAGESASRLTKQLLSFSRKAPMEVQPLDLNAIVHNMDQMLRRTLAGDIELETVLGEGLPSVRMDMGHLEQVIMNLAVNARDAMPGGGTLRIRTSGVTLGVLDCEVRSDVTPGTYVVFEITDEGCGMSKDTLEHAFEPFYTTKAKGTGTGLGLSTVYGIIKQSQGHIEYDSKPGEGTTCRVYLPADIEPAEPLAAQKPPGELRGSETVLLVEDEDSVRALGARVSTNLGYEVITARHGEEAMQVCDGHGNGIDLLVTDVVMPQMGGPELVRALRKEGREMKVLYVSGFTGHQLAAEGVRKHDAPLLIKPYTRESLMRKVRDVLDTN